METSTSIVKCLQIYFNWNLLIISILVSFAAIVQAFGRPRPRRAGAGVGNRANHLVASQLLATVLLFTFNCHADAILVRSCLDVS